MKIWAYMMLLSPKTQNLMWMKWECEHAPSHLKPRWSTAQPLSPPSLSHNLAKLWKRDDDAFSSQWFSEHIFGSLCVVMLRDKYGAVANYEFFQSLGCREKLGLGLGVEGLWLTLQQTSWMSDFPRPKLAFLTLVNNIEGCAPSWCGRGWKVATAAEKSWLVAIPHHKATEAPNQSPGFTSGETLDG